MSDSENLKILEIGCGRGEDYIEHCKSLSNLELYGIDIFDYSIEQENFTFMKADAKKIDFPDMYFDFVLSFGVLEHIQPIEKLSIIIKEMGRVSKSSIHVVPAVSTKFETLVPNETKSDN